MSNTHEGWLSDRELRVGMLAFDFARMINDELLPEAFPDLPPERVLAWILDGKMLLKHQDQRYKIQVLDTIQKGEDNDG
jgi:hypothetical protein